MVHLESSKIQDRQIVSQNLAEEQDGLVLDIALQLRVVPFGKQLRVGLERLAQIAGAQPLLDEASGEVSGLRIAQHAGDLAPQDLRILQLPLSASASRRLSGVLPQRKYESLEASE